MKNIISILIILIAFPVSAQETSNFSVEEGKIIWQKVYETELSQEEIRESISQDAILNKIAENFSGEAGPVNAECESSQAIYMRDAFQYFVNLDFKDGRYRVTISNIKFIPSQTVELWGVESSSNPVAWEDFQLRNRDNTFRDNKMAENSRECLDKYFQETFKFTKEAAGDW